MAVIVELKEKLRTEIKKAVKASDLKVDSWPGEAKIEKPREEEHGDYATNIALVLSGQIGASPREIAQKIVGNFSSLEFVKQLEIAGPGFVNFHLGSDWLKEVIREINDQKDGYGKLDLGNNKSVQVEFVSANPTGPLHVGHGRGAVVGDVLANILETAGFSVGKEYYINDAGNQMELLGQSVALRYRQILGEEVSFPDDSYQGDYIKEIAKQLIDEEGKDYLKVAKEDKLDYFKEYAYQSLLSRIKEDLNQFGVKYDNWFSEQTLHPEAIKEVVKFLQEKDLVYEEEGALWFAATQFGDDKDRVVVKEDGNPTYLAADIAYHRDKFKRGFEELINIWGADHHGYVERMKASIEALGYKRDDLEIVLVQMVSLLRDGEEIAMSKRSGEFITLREVIEEVGADAARYFYIQRSFDSHLDFDLELAKEESTDNPVYYIQYAHARICSLLEKIREEGLEIKPLAEVNLNELTSEAELDLIQMLAEYPEEIAECAQSREPHHLARYAYELAGSFHKFYNKCKVLDSGEESAQARIKLVQACQQVLINVLEILGISAPKSM